ncbi:hypothetical protein [Nodularia chucula]|uniref:hypothetical protein n=1 Tax=Nodularia chucula TaxID=3093667 RepID=UPI0039C6D4F8
MVKYDPSVIQAIVEQLYSKANSILISHRVIGVIVGCLIGSGGAASIRGSAIIGLFIGGLIGYVIGNEMGLSKSLLYKFQAQMLLTQVEIEKNTYKLIEISAKTSDIIEVVQDFADR